MDFQRIGPFERILEAIFWNFLRSPYNRSFARGLDLKGNERVLEFGSGSGAVSRHLARLLGRKGRLVCVDTSSGLMAIARKRLKNWSNVEFHDADLPTLHLSKGSFDVVVVHFALHDVPTPLRASLVREMARLLKAGGRLILREPTRPGHGMSPQEARDLARSAGLIEESYHQGRRLAVNPFFHAVFRASA